MSDRASFAQKYIDTLRTKSTIFHLILALDSCINNTINRTDPLGQYFPRG